MKKNVQRINESQLRAIVAESVKKVLGESEERADLIHGDESSRRIPKQDPYHYNDGPSPLEEEFEDELYNLIDSYKDTFINYGWKLEEFRARCYEIINEV